MSAPSIRRALQGAVLLGALAAAPMLVSATAAGQPAEGGAPPPAQPGAGGPRPGGPGGPGGPGARGPGGARGPEMSIEGAMKVMNGGYSRLSAQITDPTKVEENLRIVGEMQRGCVVAKNQSPKRQLEKAADDAERTRLTEDFRRRLIALARKLLDVEADLLDKKFESAQKHLDEAHDMGDAGHEALKVE
ncbi:MAG: hypothetical protein ACKVS8_12300 [Phycisphaerales bacterium]